MERGDHERILGSGLLFRLTPLLFVSMVQIIYRKSTHAHNTIRLIQVCAYTYRNREREREKERKKEKC